MTTFAGLPKLPPPSPLWWLESGAASLFGAPLALELVATTGVGGFALQNATPTILEWAVPDDGEMHRFMIFGELDITAAETGGLLYVSYTMPNGTVDTPQLSAGGQTAGTAQLTFFGLTVQGGSAVKLHQNALTAGAATVWAEIWAA